MASLIENLIDVLTKENDEYEKLLNLSMEKTQIIVAGDVDALNAKVNEEQLVVGRINNLEKKRIEATNDIAMVLNRKPEDMTLGKLSELLAGQKAESEAIKSIHDKLRKTLANMVKVNESNMMLLQESIDMVQFEMNIMQSLKQGPATNNYSGRSYADESFNMRGSFDAKQ